MRSDAATVEQYLAQLPDDRRAALSAVRKVILQNLDSDYEECMQYGMIGYVVPHRVHAAGYHCDPAQPVPFAHLASQKNHMAVYLMAVYGGGEHEKWFREAWARTGKKLDMGKACIRFRKLDDLALDVIGESIRRMTAKKYLERYQASLEAAGRPAAGRPAPRKRSRPKKPRRP